MVEEVSKRNQLVADVGGGAITSARSLDYMLIIVMRTAEEKGGIVCAPPLLPVLLHSAHHKDSMYIMTLGNWNGEGSNPCDAFVLRVRMEDGGWKGGDCNGNLASRVMLPRFFLIFLLT